MILSFFSKVETTIYISFGNNKCEKYILLSKIVVRVCVWGWGWGCEVVSIDLYSVFLLATEYVTEGGGVGGWVVPLVINIFTKNIFHVTNNFWTV
jgi:hypothetical protein